jgi:exonuclease III
MNFLFWNINKNKNCFSIIRDMIYTEDIDILMIAEYPLYTSEDELLAIINKQPCTYQYEYLIPIAEYDKVKIFTRFNIKLIQAIRDSIGFSAKKYFSPLLNNEITLITCHLPSKVNKSDLNLSEYAEDVKDFVDVVEKEVGHKRTIICGDFNMNPFDYGIIKTRGLHAVMEKSIAKQEHSTVRGNNYSFFYNPMWGFLGDNGCGNVSGTMYYNSSDAINYYWHLYDQVLIRPELIDTFDNKRLEILTNVRNINLLTDKKIINKKISDHLPIKFNLKI